MLRLDWNLLFTVVNLLIWYALIRKFLFKPVDDIISKREEAIKNRYAEAEKLADEAQAEKEKCAVYQTEIEQEKTKVMNEAQESARAEYNNILKEARKKAEQLLEESRQESRREKEKMVQKAEQEIRSLIMDTAVQSMQGAQDDGTVYDKFLIKAGEMNHAEHK